VVGSFAESPDGADGPTPDTRSEVSLLVQAGPDPVVVEGDQAAIERAVRNLVDNARRHARSTVRVWLEPGPETVEIVVADDGPGIPAEELERVFDRLHRLDPSRSRSHGGAGLGLAIVRGIARSHGGDARVQLPAAGGTVVHLRLPRHPPQADPQLPPP
jgi:signal transduction histidine kinase